MAYLHKYIPLFPGGTEIQLVMSADHQVPRVERIVTAVLLAWRQVPWRPNDKGKHSFELSAEEGIWFQFTTEIFTLFCPAFV